MWFKIQKDEATRLAPGNVRNNRVNKLNESRILAGYYGFNAKISLRFKQSRISLLIPHIYVLGRFVNFLVIFRYIWR